MEKIIIVALLLFLTIGIRAQTSLNLDSLETKIDFFAITPITHNIEVHMHSSYLDTIIIYLIYMVPLEELLLLLKSQDTLFFSARILAPYSTFDTQPKDEWKELYYEFIKRMKPHLLQEALKFQQEKKFINTKKKEPKERKPTKKPRKEKPIIPKGVDVIA